MADGNEISGLFGDGVYLDNSGAISAKTVTLSGASVFNGNFAQYNDGTPADTIPEAGLEIFSKGNITVNNITANDNVSGAGALLDNSQGGSTVTVTLTGFGTFNNNDGDGLDINSKNTVTLTKITADDNLGDITSQYDGEGLNVTTNGKLTLTCGEFANNVDYGINLKTRGTATISGAVLVDNGSGDSINQTGSGNLVSSVRTCSLP